MTESNNDIQKHYFSLENLNSPKNEDFEKMFFFVIVFNDRYTTPKYVERALAISSFYLFPNEFFHLLEYLYHTIINQQNYELSLEKIVHKLVYYIPSPLPGFKDVSIQFFEYGILYFKLNKINQIPKCKNNLIRIFEYCDLEFFLKNIFIDVLLEKPIIVFSKSNLLLSNFIQGIIELLYPFKYQYTSIEVLPRAYYKTIQYLSSFLIGINDNYNYGTFFSIYGIIFQKVSKITIIELEAGKNPKKSFYNQSEIIQNISLFDLKLNNRTTPSSKNNILTQPISFPEHYTKKFIDKFYDLLPKKDIKEQKDLKQMEIANTIIRESFYEQFFVPLFTNLSDNLINTSNNNYLEIENKNGFLCENFFNKENFFKKTKNSSDIPFYNNFFNTKIFSKFIYDFIFHPTNQSLVRVLLFEENVNKKKTRSLFNRREKKYFVENDEINKINTNAQSAGDMIYINNSLEFKQKYVKEIKYWKDIDYKLKEFPILNKTELKQLENNLPKEQLFQDKKYFDDFLIKCLNEKNLMKYYSETNAKCLSISK